jgi:hypothetical protein
VGKNGANIEIERAGAGDLSEPMAVRGTVERILTL